MLEPLLCPAGFVCSEFGLPQPVLQCPAGHYCPPGTLTEDVGGAVVNDPNAPPFTRHESWALPSSLLSYPYNLLPGPYDTVISPAAAYGTGAGSSGASARTGSAGYPTPLSRLLRGMAAAAAAGAAGAGAASTSRRTSAAPPAPPRLDTTTPATDWSQKGALASSRFDAGAGGTAGGYYSWPTSPVASWRDWNRALYMPD